MNRKFTLAISRKFLYSGTISKAKPSTLLSLLSQMCRLEAWWLSGSAPDCCPAVPGSNPVSPQPTADCQSSGGLPPGMALGCGLTSVRGARGKTYEKWAVGRQKHKKKKKEKNIRVGKPCIMYGYSAWTHIVLTAIKQGDKPLNI